MCVCARVCITITLPAAAYVSIRQHTRDTSVVYDTRALVPTIPAANPVASVPVPCCQLLPVLPSCASTKDCDVLAMSPACMRP